MHTDKELELYADLAGVSTIVQILNIILRVGSGISRAELARVTGFSKSTISQHVEKLIHEGLIIESGISKSSGGRKSQLLEFNKDNGYVLGIDLGATSLNIGLCNIIGEPLETSFNEAININMGPEEILKIAIGISYRLLEKRGIKISEIHGIGMGVPGPVEFSTGRPIAPPIMQGWDGFPVRDYLQEEFGRKVFVDNDVNLMALAEYWMGIAKQDQNFIFVKLGTGIGSGIFCGGKIYRGFEGCAGDIGHIAVGGSSIICSCGNVGCLEKMAGGAAIVKQAKVLAQSERSEYLAQLYKNGEEITCKSVYEAVRLEDQACMELVKSAGNYIGEVLAKIVNFYNPSMVIFGGGLANFGDILLTPVREIVYGRSSALATRNLVVKRSILGDQAGIIGAAILAREEMFRQKEVVKAIG